MTVEAFRLKNFMAFEDTGWIELQPICLLFGRNSTGKSVIIRALRFLKQSLDCPSGEGPFALFSERGIDLGESSEIAPNRQTDLPLIIHFRCRLETVMSLVKDNIDQRNSEHQRLHELAERVQSRVELTLEFSRDQQGGGFSLEKLRIECPTTTQDDEQTFLNIFSATHLDDYFPASMDRWWFWSDVFGNHMSEDEDASWVGISIERTSGFLPSLIDSSTTTVASNMETSIEVALTKKIFEGLQNSITKFLRDFEHLGPIRLEPRRLYMLSEQERRSWRQHGWDAFYQLLTRQFDEKDLTLLRAWFTDLGLGGQLEIDAVPVEGNRPGVILAYASQINIYELNKRFSINLNNSGFGASQVLPILAASLLANSGNTVIIEQPELHLDTEAQAKLADFFIDCVERNGCRFVLETHSENILLRLQRRIAETYYDELNEQKRKEKAHRNEGHSIKPEMLRVVFVTRKEKSQTEFIRFDHLGELVNPSEQFQNFFERDYDDTFCTVSIQAEIKKLEFDNDYSS